MENYKLTRVSQTEECLLFGCPAVYELTPEKNRCAIGACPSVFGNETNDYYIVGQQVNPSEVGLGKKVGEGEVLIKVPKELIDKIKRD